MSLLPLNFENSQWIRSLNGASKSGPSNFQQTDEYKFFTSAMEFDNNTSFFFSVFALEGHLAWEDFMNIEDIGVEVRVACSF